MMRFVKAVALVALSVFSFAAVEAAEPESASDIQKLLDSAKALFKAAGVEVYSPFCTVDHPERAAFIRGMTEAQIANACLIQYPGPLAQAAQDLRREKAILAAQVASLKAANHKLVLENGTLGERVKEAAKAFIEQGTELGTKLIEMRAVNVTSEGEVARWKNAAAIAIALAVFFFVLVLITSVFRRRRVVERLHTAINKFERENAELWEKLEDEKQSRAKRSATRPVPST